MGGAVGQASFGDRHGVVCPVDIFVVSSLIVFVVWLCSIIMDAKLSAVRVRKKGRGSAKQVLEPEMASSQVAF